MDAGAEKEEGENDEEDEEEEEETLALAALSRIRESYKTRARGRQAGATKGSGGAAEEEAGQRMIEKRRAAEKTASFRQVRLGGLRVLCLRRAAFMRFSSVFMHLVRETLFLCVVYVVPVMRIYCCSEGCIHTRTSLPPPPLAFVSHLCSVVAPRSRCGQQASRSLNWIGDNCSDFYGKTAVRILSLLFFLSLVCHRAQYTGLSLSCLSFASISV